MQPLNPSSQLDDASLSPTTTDSDAAVGLPKCRPPNPAPRAPTFAIPAGAIDAHCHIFGPSNRYARAGTRLFDPPEVYWQDYLDVLRALRLDRAVLVHSAVYGFDNSVCEDAIATAPDHFRGVALIGDATSAAEIERLTKAGFRGFRINLVSNVGLRLESARKLAELARPFGWHMQLLMNVEAMPDLDTVLGEFVIDAVIDHMGRPDPALGTDAPGFQALVRYLKSGRGWAKLSAPYRTSMSPPVYDDLEPFARALVQAAPDRLVWGSDWPHVMVQGDMPNDGDLCDLLARWVPDPSLRNRILVDNPAKLYGFD